MANKTKHRASTKLTLMLATMVFSSSALAGNLPIPDKRLYCGEGIEVSADGFGWEDAFCTPTGPVSFGITFQMTCKGAEDDEPEETLSATLTDNGDGTLTYSDETGPVRLEQCE